VDDERLTCKKGEMVNIIYFDTLESDNGFKIKVFPTSKYCIKILRNTKTHHHISIISTKSGNNADENA